MKISIFEPYNNLMELLMDYYTDDISIDELQLFIDYLELTYFRDTKFLFDYINIIDSLNNFNINSNDFSNLTNIGYSLKDKSLIYFDLGFADISGLPELSTFYFEDEQELFDMLGFNGKKPKSIGHGGNGEAFDYGTEVIKTTIDIAEVYNSHLITLREIPHINYIHEVFRYKLYDLEIKYCIIQDKLKIDSDDVKKRYKNINLEFVKFRDTNN